MSICLGFGLGLTHTKGTGAVVPPPTGQLLIDGNPILIDTFAIVFA